MCLGLQPKSKEPVAGKRLARLPGKMAAGESVQRLA